MSINGIRRLGGAVLPEAVPALGGAAPRAPSVGHGSAQHAGLLARASMGSSSGATTPRVGVAKLPSLNVGHALDSARAKIAEGPHQVLKSAVLRGTYSAAALSGAMDAAVKGLAGLKRDFPGMA